MIKGMIMLAAASKKSFQDPLNYPTDLPHVSAGQDQLQNALQIVFGIAAALAVLMIVIAGFRFIVGQGSPQEVSKARSTIIYSVVGLLVAVIAEAIVTLTLSNL